MRALILLLSALVIALAVLIMLSRPSEGRPAPVFEAMRLITDARIGETATYRTENGETLTFKVELAVPSIADRPPLVRVVSILKDQRGKPIPGGSAVYDHIPSRHGLFPLTAPGDPEGYDRVWVWERIRSTQVQWKGKDRPVWRIDLFDPALPPEGGADHVVALVDPAVPVYGLLRWQRGGRTWELAHWGPR